MQAGKLRHRVSIQQRIEAQDTYGQPIESWLDVAKVFAAVEPLQGREYFQAQQVNAETTTQIRIRYRDGIEPKLRVVFDGVYYNIQSVINVNNRNRELILMCGSGISDGG